MNIIHEMASAMRGSKAWPAVFDAGSAEVLTMAALKVLRQRGFITAEGLIAIKQAEADGNADAGEAA